MPKEPIIDFQPIEEDHKIDFEPIEPEKKKSLSLGYGSAGEALQSQKSLSAPSESSSTSESGSGSVPVTKAGAMRQNLQLMQDRNKNTINRISAKKSIIEIEPVLKDHEDQLKQLTDIVNNESAPYEERVAAQKKAQSIIPQYEKDRTVYNKAIEAYNKHIEADKLYSTKLVDNEKMMKAFGDKEYSVGKNFLESLQKNSIEAAAGIANIFNTLGLSGDTEGGDEVDQEAVRSQTRDNIQKIRDWGNSLVTQQKPEEYKSLFTGKFSAPKLLDISLEAISSSIPTVAAGLTTAGTATALTGAGMMFNESKDILKQAGLTDEQSEWGALGLSIPLGALEAWGVHDVISAVNSSGVSKLAMSEFIKNVAGKNLGKEELYNVAKKSLGDKIKENAPSILKTGLTEAGTEVSQGTLQELAKQGAQEISGTDSDENMPSGEYFKQQLENRANEAVGGFIGGAGLQTVGSGINAASKSFTPSVYQRALEYKTPEHFEDFKNELEKEVQSGIITPKQADEALSNIQSIQEADLKIPASIKNIDARTAAVNLIIEKNSIQSDIEGKDESLIEPEQTRLKEIDAELKDIAAGKYNSEPTAMPEAEKDGETINNNDNAKEVRSNQEVGAEGRKTAENSGENSSSDLQQAKETGTETGNPELEINTEQPQSDEEGINTNNNETKTGERTTLQTSGKSSGEVGGEEYGSSSSSGRNQEVRSEKDGENGTSGQEEKVAAKELSPEERTNLESIAEKVGENFRVVQNVYNKYDGKKPLSEITVEDFETAQSKRDKVKSEQGEEKGKREYTRKFLENESIRPEIKKVVSQDEEAVYYNKLPNDVTEREAGHIINTFGVDEAISQYKDHENNMSLPVRNVLGFAIINHLNENKQYAKAADVALEIERGVARSGTETAQSLQSFKIWYRMHPASAVIHAQKIVRQQNEQRAQSDKRLKKITKSVKKINQETAEEVVKKVEKKIKQAASIDVKENVESPRYGESNRLVTKKRYQELRKKLKGKFHSGIDPELIEVTAYHLEASGRKFSDFAQKMIRELGIKVRPYLKSLYDKAKSNLEEVGYDDFQPEDQVQAEFSALMKTDVQKTLKSLDIRIRDLIIQHYTVVDHAGKTLSEKLVEDTGLSGKEAKELSDAVQKEFDRLATEAKKKMLQKLFGAKKVQERHIKSLEDEIIKLTNIGAFSDDDIIRQYAEKMGWPKLSAENIKEIERLAQEVQKAKDGFEKDERIQDLLAYQANIKGIDWKEIAMAVWYANMLSGIATQAKNTVSNVTNTTALAAGAMIQKPAYSIEMAQAYLNGIKRGILEAGHTLQTGYSPIRGKTEIPNVLERTKFTGFGKALQYHKYVRRVMVAADVIFYEASKEMRAYQLAVKQAINENGLQARQEVKNRAAQLVGSRDYQQEASKIQAHEEYTEKVDKINSSNLSETEKKQSLAMADKKMKRRIYELIEQARPADLVEDSHSFAKKATYNAPPEGLLGAMSNAMNFVSSKLPAFKLIVPFTNIIANVANETINYSPLGYVGAATNRGGVFTKAKNFTEQDRIDLITKATIGTAIMTAIYLLSGSDDDDAVIQITANGHGDYAKNEALRATGWQPYSVKVGDQWVSYQYTPFVSALAYVGNIRDFEKYREAKIDDKFWTKYGVAARWTTRTILDATAVSSLDNFLGAVMDGRNEDAISTLTKSQVRTAKSFVIPAIYEQEFRRIEDWFGIPDKETQGTAMGQVWRNIPFARDAYFNKVNALGREIPPDADVFVSGQEEDSEIFKAITDKGLTIAAPSYKKMQVNDPVTNQDRMLTQQEFYDFSKKRGELMRTKLESGLREFEKMNHEQAKDYLKDVIQDAHKEAKFFITHSKSEYEVYRKIDSVEKEVSAEKKAEKEAKSQKSDERLEITMQELELREKFKHMSRKELIGKLLELKKQDPENWREKRHRFEKLDIIPRQTKQDGGLTEFGKLLKESGIDLK